MCSSPAAPVGGVVTGGVRCLGDSYYMSADVSHFEPHDVVVMAYNHHVVIHAEKVCVCVCMHRREYKLTNVCFYT